MVLSDALAVQSQGYQGPKVSSPKVVLGSQKWFGVSRNALGSQKMLDIVVIVDSVDNIDIVNTVEAIWNNARH